MLEKEDVGMNLSEELYILYRRAKAAMSWSVYLACSIFPIRRNKIVFSAFEGGGYGCNPKYIAEELIRRMHKDGKAYEMVWLVNDMTKKFPKEITPVKNTLWNRAYHLSTAKVWVDNARKNFGTRKRKGQFYMQTWHGQIGVKPVGRLRGKSFSRIAEMVTKYDAKLEDAFLINSEYARDIFKRSFYKEPLVKTGSPRCDVLINNREKQRIQVRKEFNLEMNTKLVMYAPTFRGGSQNIRRNVMQEKVRIDFLQLRNALADRFGGTWYIFLRLHPQLALKSEQMKVNDKFKGFCIDVSLKDDMYEYLSSVDAFISDYSSVAMDAAIMDIPVFTYADDMDFYEKDRGNLLCDLNEFPFPIANTMENLVNIIETFDTNSYLAKLREFFQKEEVFEDGQASKRVVDMITKYLSG